MLADRIAVLYRGGSSRRARAPRCSARRKDPYTQRLLASLPVPDPVEQAARRETWRNLRAHG